MPKISRELSALEVKRLKHSGARGNTTYACGGVSGLLLQITPKGGRTWLLRVTVGGKRREIGLGSFMDVTLSQAKERAREAKDQIRHGIDPIEERRKLKATLDMAQRSGKTFEDATSKYLEAKLESFQNLKHRDQWRNTLQTYAMPQIGAMLVEDIEVQDVLRVLEPIWYSKTETASRVRGRIEAVLSWSSVAGYRSGDNPARWAGNLKELLPAPSKVAKRDNHPALQIQDATRWFNAIKERDGMGARALELAALTAVRSKEVRGALWDEIDSNAGVWVIPAARMKMKKEHRVPLSTSAINLLKNLPLIEDNPLIFPAPHGGIISDMTLSAAMKRLHKSEIAAGKEGFLDRVSKRPAVPHGLRSTFRDWVSECTNFSGDMAEMALAHTISSAVEASYRRGNMLEKRREMMASWADFLEGKILSDT